VDRSESECTASQGFHLRIVCNGRQQRRGIGSSNEAEGALQKSGDGVEAPRRFTGREREGASLDGLHLGRHPLLRHRLPQPETLAAPARTETHSASLAHAGRVCVRRCTSGRAARAPCSGAKAGGPTAAPQHSMSRHPSEEEAVTPRLLSLAPPSPADEVSSDAMIGRYVVGEVSSRFRYSKASSD
ncbi:unnamed protein product, partial [Musa textilis]